MAEISNYSTSQGLSETVIPVHFHVITSADGNMGDLSDSTVAEQVEVMNNAFGPAGFSFKTVDINRVKNDQWFNNLDGSVWKEAAKALKQGGAGTLNIYSANLPEGILGIAQFPWEAWWRRKTDGVRCASGSFPKGNIRDFNLGMTCVHEVGHWMVILVYVGLISHLSRWLSSRGLDFGHTGNRCAYERVPKVC